MPDDEIIEEEVVEEKTVEEEARGGDELTEVEQIAKDIGWNPNHEGGDREFVGAAEFIRRSKDIQSTQTKQNKAMKREMENLKNGLTNLQKHNETVYNVQVKALKSRVRELEGRRKEAVEDGDSEAVSAIDSQITEIKNIPAELPTEQVETTPIEFEEWLETNDWYKTNDTMRAYADVLSESADYKALAQADFKRCLTKITAKVKNEFPENFPKPRKAPVANPVEGASVRAASKGGEKSKYTYNDLSRSQQDICDGFVKAGIMTKEQYIKDLETIEQNQGRV